MTDVRTNVTAAWIAILVLALGVASHFESDHRQQAQRLDLKVMTLELKGTSAVIPRMNRWRNEARAKAEKWERAVLSLSLAAAIAAISITVTGWMWLLLGGFSIVGAITAAYTAALATGVL